MSSNSKDHHECAICMSEMKHETGEEIKTTYCNHTFHNTCLSTWLIEHYTCPLCRGDIMEEREVSRNLDAAFDNAADEFSTEAEMYDLITNSRIIFDELNDGHFNLLDATEEDLVFINHWNELNPSYIVTMDAL